MSCCASRRPDGTCPVTGKHGKCCPFKFLLGMALASVVGTAMFSAVAYAERSFYPTHLPHVWEHLTTNPIFRPASDPLHRLAMAYPAVMAVILAVVFRYCTACSGVFALGYGVLTGPNMALAYLCNRHPGELVAVWWATSVLLVFVEALTIRMVNCAGRCRSCSRAPAGAAPEAEKKRK
eukprot:m51a1_g4013 hypothetical protein (179) ;mRNA; r:561468-562243